MDNNEKREAYRRLLLDQAGGLKPDALVVLEDLMAVSNFWKDPEMSPTARPGEALLLIEGARSIVRRLLRKSGAGGQMLKRLFEGDNHERDFADQFGQCG